MSLSNQPPITAEEWSAQQYAFFECYEQPKNAETGEPLPPPTIPIGTITDVPAFVKRQVDIAVLYWGNARIAGPPIRRLLALRDYVAEHWHKLPKIDEEE